MNRINVQSLLFVLLATAFVFCSCGDELKDDDVCLFPNLAFGSAYMAPEQDYGNWDEWAVRYLWYDKGVVEVKYDSTKDEYVVTADQLDKAGFERNPKTGDHTLDDRICLGLNLPKSENPFSIYLVGKNSGNKTVVLDYCLWPPKDGKFPHTKEQNRSSNGEFFCWKEVCDNEESLFGAVNFISLYFEGKEEWNEVYKNQYQDLLYVRYCAAIDAFVAQPQKCQNRNVILFVLTDFCPEELKTSRPFNMWVAGEMKPCNMRMHKDDGRLYKHIKVVDYLMWDERGTYHAPKMAR